MATSYWGWARNLRGEKPLHFVLVANTECLTGDDCIKLLRAIFRASGTLKDYTLVALPVDETPTKGKL